MLLVVVVLLGACSDSAGFDAPTVMLEASELEDLEATVQAFFDRFYEGWPDLEDRYSEFADDAVFYDPSFGDYFVGPEEIIAGWRMMPGAFPDLEAATNRLFLSAENAVFDVDWIGLFLGTKPSDVPWPAGLELFRFAGGQVASQDLWYTAETLEGPMLRCGGCTAEIQSMANRYVTAWSSGEADQIASLYSAQATLADSMFGISATGPDRIAASHRERFGSGEITMNVEGVYGVSLARPLIGHETNSNRGDITGVGVHFKWTADEGTTGTVESLALLYFGSVENGSYEADPQNLIVREEVFHIPDTLTDLTP